MALRRSPRKLLTAAAAVVVLVASGCAGTDKATARHTLMVYSAPGLSAWYKSRFEKFTRETGVAVNVFEGGSGEVVSRVNSPAVWEGLGNQEAVPPADLLITLPPFIQKAAKAGLLQAGGVDTTGISADLIGPNGVYVPIAGTALCFIANPAVQPLPTGWEDLLSPRFKGRLQYSTPGEAGDGTAVLVLLQHLMGNRGALDYLARLNANNVGPASSTGGLQAKVDSGELLVANGDVQMNLASINNDGSKFTVFFPAFNGTRTTVSLPYMAGVTAASQAPEQARALLASLLSEDAQRSLYAEASGIPVRESVAAQATGRSGAVTPNQALEGVTVWSPDWNLVLADLADDIAAYQQAVR